MSRFTLRESAIAAVALVLTAATIASAFDMRRSQIWRKLSAGQHQRLLVSGTSLSNIQYSPWPDSLKAAIDKAVGAGLLELVNISPPGGNTSAAGANCADSAHRYIDAAPDAVFIEFASNDATNRYDCTVGGCSRPSHARLIDSIRTRLPQCEIFLYITARPWDKVSCGATQCAYCTVFEAQYCRRSARPSSTEKVEDYFAAIRELADQYNTHLIDTYQRFRNIYDTDFASYVEYIYDGHHPTPRATHEIILPLMMQALKGAPLVVTAPRAGDTLRAGDTMTVRWEYDPDSLTMVDVNLSVDNGDNWLPLSGESIPVGAGQVRLAVPSRIGLISLTGVPVMVQVVQYNSGTIKNEAGPIVILPRAAVRGVGGGRAAYHRSVVRCLRIAAKGGVVVADGESTYSITGRYHHPAGL